MKKNKFSQEDSQQKAHRKHMKHVSRQSVVMGLPPVAPLPPVNNDPDNDMDNDGDNDQMGAGMGSPVTPNF